MAGILKAFRTLLTCSTFRCPTEVAFLQATSFMVHYWKEIRLYCVEPLLRALDKGDFGPFEVALVVFHGTAPFCQVPVETWPWTADLAKFRQKLDGVVFEGGGLLDCNHVGVWPSTAPELSVSET